MPRLFPINDALDTDAWYTPPWIFDGLGITFDLDVAAPAEGGFVPAHHRYTVADDGLTQPWHGQVWCNPPYSAPTAWCKRWAAHEPGGCLLIRADLSTSGPFTAWTAATTAWVAQRRVQFVSGNGTPTGTVNFSTILLGRGPTADQALHRLANTHGGTTKTLTANN